MTIPAPAPMEHRGHRYYDAPPEMPRIETRQVSKYEGGGYSVGTRVVHPKFGTGVVVLKEGAEEDLRVTVFFKTAGKKKLAVNQAKLIVL